MTIDLIEYPTHEDINKWREWDFQRMPVVSARFVTGPNEAFRLGREIDHDLRRAHQRLDQMPLGGSRAHDLELMLQEIGGTLRDYGWYRLGRIPNPGQLAFKRNPNLRMVFDPHWSRHGLVVLELGCEHQTKVVASRNCYSEVACQRCGWHWGVDSSD